VGLDTPQNLSRMVENQGITEKSPWLPVRIFLRCLEDLERRSTVPYIGIRQGTWTSPHGAETSPATWTSS
jgi:hypothetical protein